MTLQLKLKKDSVRQFFTTQMGHTIDKDHWETIVHNDKDVEFLLHREDVEVRTITEDINEMVEPDKTEKETFTEVVVEPEVKKEKPKSKGKSKGKAKDKTLSE